MVTVWLHLLALSVFLGALIGLWILVLSPLSAINHHEDQVAFLTGSLKVYNPLQIGALGLMILTGAFKITELKEIYGVQFARELGATLGLKLALAFVIILLSTYQSMGLAHRFVKRAEQPEPITNQDLGSTVQRLRGSMIIILILTLLTVLVGIRIQG